MNKNLKKTVAVAVALTAVAGFTPSMGGNLLTTKAYASSDNDEKLEKLYLKTSGGSNIKFYEDDDYDDKVDNDDISDGDTYYAKTSSSKVKISTNGPSSSYVKVFTSKTSSSKGKSTSSEISLSKGSNTIYVRVYSEKPDSSIKWKDDDDVLAEYTLKVKCTSSSSSSSSDDDDDYDDIYLDKLTVDGDSISLSKSKTTYTKTVSSSTDEVTIKAEPEDDDYDVTIDGSSVDEDDKWKKDVSLEKGKNEFKIEIEDDDDNTRTYKLVIYRGEGYSTSDSVLLDTLKVGGTDIALKENKVNYNLTVDEDCDEIYIKAEPKDSDATVEIGGEDVDDDDDYEVKANLKKNVVNTFKIKVKDSNNKEQTISVNIGRGKSVTGYPTDSTTTNNNTSTNNNTTNNTNNNTNNNTSTSVNRNKWVQNGSLWQYYDGTGNPVKNSWVGNYYLSETGYMVTNAWKDINGSWYYFDANGAKHTGWLYNGGLWYYLNNDGRMATGWFRDMNSGKWYFLYPSGYGKPSGSMAVSTSIGGYWINSNGVWVG